MSKGTALEENAVICKTELELNKIGVALSGKTIFLVPYTHADYAWMHTRCWHEMRYLVIFDKVVKLLKKHHEYRFFFDSLSELVLPCLARRPEMLTELRRAVRVGQLDFCGGQWSNVRPNQVGDETFIRNMTIGRIELRKIIPEANPVVYANLDVAIGHSQIPQLIALGGFQNYFAWRPEKGLDAQGIPRCFIWRGLSGDKIIVNRHYYGGWNHPLYFMKKYNEEDYHLNPGINFESTVLCTWNKFLRKAASENLQTISFCQGGDDALPNGDLYYGFDWNITGLMAQWNEKQRFGCIKYGNPSEMFSALGTEKKLREIRGTLDPCDVGYNIAFNGANGVWRLRDVAERELTQAEMIAALAGLHGFECPENELLECWKKHLTFCTHAIEMLFDEDFAIAKFTLEAAIRGAMEIGKRAVAKLVDNADEHLANSFCIFNPLPEKRTEIVRMSIPNTTHYCRQPVILNMAGKELPMQILSIGIFQRYFEIIAEIQLRPGAFTEIKVDWTDRIESLPEPIAVDTLNMTVRSDLLEIEFIAGRLVRIENLRSGQRVTATGSIGLLEPVSLPQQTASWMTTELAEEPLPFVPEALTLDYSGALLTRIRRQGHSGQHQITQIFDLYHNHAELVVETSIDIVPDCTNLCLRMPLEECATLQTDIPFGVEERSVADIEYGRTPKTVLDDAGENIERLLSGVFWGRSWVFAAHHTCSFGIISIDGSKYYRDYGKPRQLLNFLASIRPNTAEGAFKQTNFQRACGKNVFHHILTLDGADWRSGMMIAKSQRYRANLSVFPGSLSTQCNELVIMPEQIRLSAFYRHGDSFILRAVNLAPNPEKAVLRLPAKIESAEVTDFNGIPMGKTIEFKGHDLAVDFAPWEIITLKLNIIGNTNNK